MVNSLPNPPTANSKQFINGHAPKPTSSLWQTMSAGSSWLTVTGVLMLADILISLAGLAIERTTITGAPTWMKPLKFAISTALFSFTVAWMIGQQHRFQKLAKWLGRILALALIIEIALIDMQAARHTTSHFNVGNSFDGGVFAIMGVSIAILYATTAALFILTCFNRYQDRAQGWAIRLGLLIALTGMGTGILMVLPTPEQLAAAHATGQLTHSGAHTVGAPDGGPGMPITGWSADHGDLRIAHFLGLHAMQILLLGLWMTRSDRTNRWTGHWSSRSQLRLVLTLAASSTIAFALVLVQALHGQPILHPDTPIIAALFAWTAVTAAGLLWAASHRNSLITEKAQ
jgi:hypothetical protein